MHETILHRATFNTLVRPYLVLYVAFFLVLTIVGIPLAVIWVCGVGQWWARHYYDKLECELSTRTLRFRKGILFQVEKTIPLENIQDVTFIEGPILRYFHLSMLKFETAGQNAQMASQMQLVGIIDAHAFRQQILAARDQLRHPTLAAPSGDDAQLVALKHIASRLDEIAQLLRERH
ncbi:PH domain-containing protein [Chitinimonas sp. BJYL2]|uniref:PH domain-containing protein n=1 Tax=Chitinimonas sp. BJYL2 TaxID=2976696 RepID=UPI0022B36A0E|nr:PH domain-containing protein [Chitinimonas sp. BJYL2]